MDLCLNAGFTPADVLSNPAADQYHAASALRQTKAGTPSLAPVRRMDPVLQVHESGDVRAHLLRTSQWQLVCC